MAETEVVPIDMPDSNGEMTWQAKKLHTVFVLLYEDYLLEIAYWQMAYTVIEPFNLHKVGRILCVVFGLPSHLAVRVRHVNRNDFCFCHFTPVNTIGVNTQFKPP